VAARAVLIAALWSMVAALAGVVVVVFVGLVAAAVVGVAWLTSNGGSALADTTVIWQAATVATWVVAALVVAIAVWVAAYASTEWGSRRRALVAIAGAGMAMVAYYLLGSSGLVVAGLGLGWAIAIPAERVGRVAIRAVVSLLVALLAPAFESLSGGVLALGLALSPWVTALLFLFSDGTWTFMTKRLPTPADE
jgi:hypothetical protein